jgi:hypothetical protein
MCLFDPEDNVSKQLSGCWIPANEAGQPVLQQETSESIGESIDNDPFLSQVKAGQVEEKTVFQIL